MTILESSFKKYKTRRCKRFLLLVPSLILMYIAFYQVFITVTPSNGVLGLLSINVVFLLYLRIKRPQALNLTLNEMVLEDCDASLWLLYLSQQKNKQRLPWKLEYYSTLSLLGKSQQAYELLTKINPDNIRAIEYYVSYLLVMNDVCFYRQDIEQLKHLQKIIAKEKFNDKKTTTQLNFIRKINGYYIACLEGNTEYIDQIKKLISQSTTKLAKVKLVYLLYVTTLNDTTTDDHKKATDLLLTHGGTTFFVPQVENDLSRSAGEEKS